MLVPMRSRVFQSKSLQPFDKNEIISHNTIIATIIEIFFYFQSVIFHVAQHPRYKWFTQCVTMGFFPTTAHELAYNLFNVLALYGVPLIVIVTCYAMILWEVTRKAREGTGKLKKYIRKNKDFSWSYKLMVLLLFK